VKVPELPSNSPRINDEEEFLQTSGGILPKNLEASKKKWLRSGTFCSDFIC